MTHMKQQKFLLSRQWPWI